MGIARVSLRSWLSWGSCALVTGVLAWSGFARTFELHHVNPPPAVLKSHQVQKQGLPFYFEANQGQTEGRVSFLARARGYIGFLSPTEIVLAFDPLTNRRAAWDPAHRPVARPAAQPIRMRFVGANSQATLRGSDAQSGKVHYFIGRDESGWHRHVDTFAHLDARQVYPGIDVRYYGGGGRELAFDAIVSPYADPSQLRLAFDGAKRIEVSEQGALQVDTGSGLLQLSKPFVYQEGAAGRRPVEGRYLLDQGEVRIQLGAYDRSRALVIDPVFAYSTYLGGTNDEYAYDIKVDQQGYIYVIGPTLSTDFLIKNAIQPLPKFGITYNDMFVSKLTPDGSALVYSTYFGGNSEEYPGAIALGSDNSVYIAGGTLSPTTHSRIPFRVRAYQMRLDSVWMGS